MPGLQALGRRWSIGSDDLILPAIILFVVHSIWLILLVCLLGYVSPKEWKILCMRHLHELVIGYLVLLSGSLVVEICIAWVSCRGSIMDTKPRSSIQYILYVRAGILFVEIFWTIFALMWIVNNYQTCIFGFPRDLLIGIVICNCFIFVSIVVTMWCTFDAAGRSWVKMQQYQDSMRDGNSKYSNVSSFCSHFKRKAMRQYQDSWNRRCELLFCCIANSDRHQQNSFAEIAKLLSEFFRDLDVVPSDVIAGLILQRRLHKQACQEIIKEPTNQIYQYLSGVPITPDTKFLDTTHHAVVQDMKTLIHYLHYAIAVYGWPLFFMNNKKACFQLCPYLRCNSCLPRSDEMLKFFCCFMGKKPAHESDVNSSRFSSASVSHSSNSPGPPPHSYEPILYGDNCCLCNYAASKRICQDHNMEIVYATYHVEIGEPPFFVALDHDRRTVVISIRGTLSLQDVITDLNAEAEFLPTNPPQENWLGHKGMIEAALYIRRKLADERILERALSYHPQKGTQNYSLVLVGHSLGAGTATILAILLREVYNDLVCYAFSPPGGLLSLPAVEYTKQFTTSVVLGKDVVPRLGLHQMEALRFDLMAAIKQSNEPKWKTIATSFCCCSDNSFNSEPDDTETLKDDGSLSGEKELSSHPEDSSIALTVHQPLYPPGKIIHIVRNHPPDREKSSKWANLMGKSDPVYQALWVDNTEYDQILISPVMVQDHWPDQLLEGLEKLLVNTGPPKPTRRTPTEFDNNLRNSIPIHLSYPDGIITPNHCNSGDHTPSHRIVLETSFTDLRPDGLDQDDSKLIPPCLKFTNYPYKPTLYNALRRARKFDLLRDDWFGLAPLATPEASETASISSSQSACLKLLPSHLNPIVSPISENNQSDQSPESKKSILNAQSLPSIADASMNHLSSPASTPFNEHKISSASLSHREELSPPSSSPPFKFSPLNDDLNLDPNALFYSVKRKLEENSSKSKLNCPDNRSSGTISVNDNFLSANSNSETVSHNESPDSAIQIIPCSQPSADLNVDRALIASGCSGTSSGGGFDCNSIGAYCQSTSSTNISQASFDVYPSLLKSHEKLANSDDNVQSCETRPSSGRLTLMTSSAGKSSANYSPKSELLFRKLKSIENMESPSEDISPHNAFETRF
ncbi:inactivation no afterpotential E isoform X2 [Brevipalpus obovatus]|uniref:inactivation no afterpotential E isoform X2 n=1 Tax=Brevipalpus obovatus TaxID=246614 RepID=UPI003D9EBD3B